MFTIRRLTVGLPILLALMVAMTTAPAQSSDRDLAQSRAEKFLKAFGDQQFRSAFKEQTSVRFRQNVTEEAFVAQSSLLYQQLGGRGTHRRLIDERHMSQIPMPQSPPISGTFYMLRFKTSYPYGNVYEDATVEREGNGQWKIIGFYFYPAPD